MNWVLATASSRYVVGFADAAAGPVLQDWTSGEVRDWRPDPVRSMRTEPDRIPSEYSALGTRHVRGADLIVDHGDGLLGARLVWSVDQVDLVDDGTDTRLTALAADTTGSLLVRLEIRASRSHDVVTKQVTITNTGTGVLHLERAFSPAWELPVQAPARVDILAGHWAREFQPLEVALPAGELAIGSRQGVTSHNYSPVVTVRGAAGQQAYSIALGWSGSWRMLVDAHPFLERLRVAGGVDDETTRIRLGPGESFTTPPVHGVHAPDGTSGIRRRWHDYQRGWLARDLSPATRPVVYNSWYATTFDVRLEHQLALAARAADLGVEAFVVDDGWFAGRTSDSSGLGNWWPDPATFPDGLDPLVAGVTGLGLRFGIWVEPEAVNPGAQVFADHPDWVYRAGDRPLVTVRNQYVLDFGRPEVIGWVCGWLRTLLADRRITYLKWDMNRPVSDGGRPGDPHGRQWPVQHADGYYQVMAMLRREFPWVTVEACSGGGGRIDLAVLECSDVVWTSDETGPRDRLVIQHGFLSAYGSHVMSSWVTDEPDLLDADPASFEFRFVVAMAGVLGIGADLLAWSDQQHERARELVQVYRRIRHTIHTGRVEIHGSPADSVYAIEYGGPDQTVFLVYTRPGRPHEVLLTPSTLGQGVYRLDGQPVHAGESLRVPFRLSPDADVLILERER